jgi:hypothetical protein
MLNNILRFKWLILSLLAACLLVTALWQLAQPSGVVRGKSAAHPLPDGLTPEQTQAQDLALADPRVTQYTVGHRSEVFGVRRVGPHYPASSVACANADCRQVEIYNFDENAAVVAIVNLDTQRVLEVFHQPGVQPGINQRLMDLAVEITRNDPNIAAEVGRSLADEDIVPMQANLLGTPCNGEHICVASTFGVEGRMIWAFVDLTDEVVVGTRWTKASPIEPGDLERFEPEAVECTDSETLDRAGWTMDYQVTGTDGLRVYNVKYNDVLVMTSAKLVEWHADYGGFGYEDSTGCGGDGGGFPIYPYGGTQILNWLDPTTGAVIGFEVVQDFRMPYWGDFCNYRYEQHFQFYADGRFRVVSGAYGKGCGTNAMYRPVVRIDIAVAGDEGDNFAVWDGANWAAQSTEAWWSQVVDPAQVYQWFVSDTSGDGYYLEPGQGQFGDGGRGDNAFIYVTQHHPDEGDADLGVIGTCCNDDYQQGPETYLDGEAISDQNLVIWYVPQMLTDADPPDYYCWTVKVGDFVPPIGYPCFGGPMFVPTTRAGFVHSGPVAVGAAAVFTDTSAGPEPRTYAWDFGDGVGTSVIKNPTYTYAAPGVYTVTLTVTSPFDGDVFSSTIEAGIAAVAGFSHNGPVYWGTPVAFTNISTGDEPLTYAWDFGDGVGTSSQRDPTYVYALPGVYTVTLTTSNPFGSSTVSSQVEVVAYRTYLPMLGK